MAILRIAAQAAEDIAALLAHTDDRFGQLARLRYETLIVTALRDIAREPERMGSIARPELGPDIRSYHLRHSRERARTEDGAVRRPRHLLLYRHAAADVVGIGRVLHDAMELERHRPTEFGDG